MLADIHELGDTITLIPNSGVQFVDFAFDLDAIRRSSRTFIERPVGASGGRERVELLRVPEVADDAEPPAEMIPRGNDRTLDVNATQALECFLQKWVPVPYLRIESGTEGLPEVRFDDGPTNWARVRVVALTDRVRGGGPSHRATFAFDTSLEQPRPNRPYVAPGIDDVTGPVRFRFASALSQMAWFISDTRTEAERTTKPWFQAWVDEWLRGLLQEFAASRRGRGARDEEDACRLEHWMRYVAFLETLQTAIRPPTVRLVDTVTPSEEPGAQRGERRKTPRVSCDLVLDIGNSRTCGLLIETFPNDAQVDLNNSIVLHLRDLGRPEFQYSEPFSSHVELAQPDFGRQDLSRQSTRERAFFWPGAVRVGPEAVRLRAQADGTRGVSGMSSPKRYLWDVEPAPGGWVFQPGDYLADGHPPPVEAHLRRRLNAAGDVIAQLRAEKKTRQPQLLEPAREIGFSRSSFFTLMIAEVVMQSIAFANSVGHRHIRPLRESPRVIERIVFTVPPATTLQEQQIMRSRVEGALRLVWEMMGWEAGEGREVPAELAPSYPRRPACLLNLDEASCVQFVWLYGEIAKKFAGAAKEYADLVGRPRPFAEPDQAPDPAAPTEPSIRVASVDIGGGTTDLMVTTYYIEDRALKPTQNFREGFRRAGDDLLRGVIEQMVFPAIEAGLDEAGVAGARAGLTRVFGGDRAGIPVQEKELRRQLALLVLYPVGIAILQAHEATSPAAEEDVTTRTFAQLLGDDAAARIAAGERAIPAHLLEYLERELRLPAELRLEDIPVPLDFGHLREIAERVLGEIVDNLCEAVDAYDVDVLLLSGRPARLPAIKDMFVSRLPVAPDRIVSLADYRADVWYPFRKSDNSSILDPKTCTAVGGVLCVLAERQIENFTLLTDRLQMRSTARFIGQMESTGQITDARLMFSEVDLDARGTAAPLEATVTYFAPMRIGFRQIPLERWTTTPLYRLEFVANQNFTTDSLPFELTIARDEPFEDDPEMTPAERFRAQAGREQFAIIEAVDAKRRPRKHKTEFRLYLCTMPSEEGYWLDTGAFLMT